MLAHLSPAEQKAQVRYKYGNGPSSIIIVHLHFQSVYLLKSVGKNFKFHVKHHKVGGKASYGHIELPYI